MLTVIIPRTVRFLGPGIAVASGHLCNRILDGRTIRAPLTDGIKDREQYADQMVIAQGPDTIHHLDEKAPPTNTATGDPGRSSMDY
jgi:hypothetical protein